MFGHHHHHQQQPYYQENVVVTTEYVSYEPPQGYAFYSSGHKACLRSASGHYLVGEDGAIRPESHHHGTCDAFLTRAPTIV
jgi:hypothetical protein